ncbi:MAG: Radical SAM domain protein [Candidatus Woesebacteria bacterium GW2011_GWA1_37_7]|uniref:Radical SAM domain protein n=1 Tax=Candidatus Woesebacteria bacterium GW2011_GWA1_37_7 TaxID=1618545 RepID=A0A0G0JK91_9BACT|nr:MAG: Radical SAM domain protein [Candidatus Woesebacteria bacterium GW2011_GWA1_37_7]
MSKERQVALVNPNCGGNYVQTTYRGREHLGLGYLAAELQRVGVNGKIIDSRIMAHRPEEAAEQILDIEPSIIAFSLIAKDATPWTEEVIKLVRQQKPDVHAVAGNYFPTLQPQRAFESVPDLDSIVIGEGDITFLEMAQIIHQGGDWTKLKGIAHKDIDGRIVY